MALRFSPIFLSLCIASFSSIAVADGVAVPENCTDEISVSNKATMQKMGWPIRLLNWNIQKIGNDGWEKDLNTFMSFKSLVLLQEATDSSLLRDALQDQNFASLAPGYHSGAVQTGVLTASSVAALQHCFMQYKEPWLRSPKAVQLSWYAIDGSEQSLLVINIHSVNFALGLSDYHQQMMRVVDIAKQHSGPMIVSGDFNTWSEKRLRRLQLLTQNLALEPVPFSGNYRKTAFGNPLDHIYIRGLELVNSYVLSVSSSDHNPLFVELALASQFSVANTDAISEH